jgi:hypothetical protein
LSRRRGSLLRLAVSAVALAALGALPACSRVSPVTEPGPAAPGYRALFRGVSEGPSGKSRFRMAAAVLPPDRLRLEFFGPVGAARLVVAVDDGRMIALEPAERVFERQDSNRAAMERLLGVPLGPEEMVDLLLGLPMCEDGRADQALKTRDAATFGRTVAWVEISCPPGDIRYVGRARERGGTLSEAVIREGLSGAIILRAEYGDHVEGLGPRWPRQIRLVLPRRSSSVELTALEGPAPGGIDSSLFDPDVPDGFEERTFLGSPAAPGLIGPDVGRER